MTTHSTMPTYSFKPSVGGRIRFFLSQLIYGAFIYFVLYWGIGLLIRQFQQPRLRILYPVAIVVILLIILWRTLRTPYTFELSYDSMVATSGGKTHKVLMEDHLVSAETLTTYVYGIPFVSRKMIIKPKHSGTNTKPISVKLLAYNKKIFAQLMTATSRIADLHEVEKRAAIEAASPNDAPTTPIVRDLENSGNTDNSLNLFSTYAIVTDPTALITKVGISTIIIFLILGIVLFVSGVFIEERLALFGGIAMVIISIIMMFSRAGSKVSKNAILGAEITPQALTINSPGNNQTYPWGQTQTIQITPLGYSGTSNRAINIITPEGVFGYHYGAENNAKLDENYYWLVEYIKLHALDKIEYLYR